MKAGNNMNVVDFNMIVEINELLKEHNIDYSVHSIGGCASCGLELKQLGNDYPLDDIITLINQYLSTKWLKVIPQDDNPFYLIVLSKFD